MTQSRKDALQDSLAKVEAGEAADKFGSMRAYWCADMQVDAMRAYSGSLDAAYDLHEAVLPGWWYSLDRKTAYITNGEDGSWFTAYSCNNPARAWLIAIIKALIAEADASPDPLR